ncbi:MAG: glutamate--tRNA ligase, partial [Coriobacteriia bacterium]|nr:glutamate--tRNA ligase [Coriobacteriia bacterium]
YNWAFARRHEGTFVLRIDDTDPARSTPENTAAILRAMRWLGLEWDEGPEAGGASAPYFQTQRGEVYRRDLERLKASGAAYPCFCTPARLDEKREAARAKGGFSGYDRACRTLPDAEARRRLEGGQTHVWRLKVPEDRGEVFFADEIRGAMTFPADALDDFVLVRSDGTPTYNFATVVDDVEMRITHVIRGDDHLSNTPRQMVLFEALGAQVPAFAHMGLILGTDGKRLSKRHGAVSVEAYRDAGYLPEALLNYLALLGWSMDAETTLFSARDLVANFDLGRVSRNPAIFDPEKLEWMNGVYIRALPPSEFVARIAPLLVEAGLCAPGDVEERRDWFLELAPLVSERVKRLGEVVPMVRFLLADDIEVDETARDKVLAQEGASLALEASADALRVLPTFTAAAVEEALRAVPGGTGLKPKTVFQAVRVAVSGATVSPPLFESLALLGKDRSVARIEAARALAAA